MATESGNATRNMKKDEEERIRIMKSRNSKGVGKEQEDGGKGDVFRLRACMPLCNTEGYKGYVVYVCCGFAVVCSVYPRISSQYQFWVPRLAVVEFAFQG
jgi:hypothetical protein